MYDKALIGLALKFIRSQQGKSQKELSEAINMTQSAISKIESGQMELDTSYLLSLLDYYKVSPNKFQRIVLSLKDNPNYSSNEAGKKKKLPKIKN